MTEVTEAKWQEADRHSNKTPEAVTTAYDPSDNNRTDQSLSLIKAHVGNNVDIYYGTIEIRADLKLTFGSRDGIYCEGNDSFNCSSATVLETLRRKI